MQYKTTQRNAMEYKTTQHHIRQRSTIKDNAAQFKTTQRSTSPLLTQFLFLISPGEEAMKLPDSIQKAVWKEKKLAPDVRALVSAFLTENKSERLGADGPQEVRDHPCLQNMQWDVLHLLPSPNLAELQKMLERRSLAARGTMSKGRVADIRDGSRRSSTPGRLPLRIRREPDELVEPERRRRPLRRGSEILLRAASSAIGRVGEGGRLVQAIRGLRDKRSPSVHPKDPADLGRGDPSNGSNTLDNLTSVEHSYGRTPVVLHPAIREVRPWLPFKVPSFVASCSHKPRFLRHRD
eukprot:scaffold1234_cov248-Pinguiococcus_pyrenoidosus.AAC.11